MKGWIWQPPYGPPGAFGVPALWLCAECLEGVALEPGVCPVCRARAALANGVVRVRKLRRRR